MLLIYYNIANTYFYVFIYSLYISIFIIYYYIILLYNILLNIFFVCTYFYFIRFHFLINLYTYTLYKLLYFYIFMKAPINRFIFISMHFNRFLLIFDPLPYKSIIPLIKPRPPSKATPTLTKTSFSTPKKKLFIQPMGKGAWLRRNWWCHSVPDDVTRWAWPKRAWPAGGAVAPRRAAANGDARRSTRGGAPGPGGGA